MIAKWTLVLAASVISGASADGLKARETSLCQIVHKPMSYNGKVVRFRAGVLTDWHHGIQLFIKGCRGGVQLISTDAAPQSEALALDQAIGNPLNGGYDRTVFAMFTGRIVWRPRTSKTPQFYNPLAVDAYRITGIQIRPHTSPR